MDTQQRTAIVTLDVAPAARPEDVASPEAVVAAVYDVISGPAEREQPRDWDRFRALFLPGAHFLLTRWGDREKGTEEEVVREWDVEGFIAAASAAYRERGFWERDVWRRAERRRPGRRWRQQRAARAVERALVDRRHRVGRRDGDESDPGGLPVALREAWGSAAQPTGR